jgi:hypothetical protein
MACQENVSTTEVLLASGHNWPDPDKTRQEFGRGCMAIATSAPIRMAGKSRPTIASAVVSERANGDTGVMSLPMVVSVAKLK